MSSEPATRAACRTAARLADSGAYRGHHGRQRALGHGARQAADRGACRRRQGAARAGRKLHQSTASSTSRCFSFSSENWTRPQGRNQLHFRAVAPFRCVRPRKAPPQQCARQDHRLARSGLDESPAPADRRGRDDDGDEYRPQAAGRLQLRRQGRDRRGDAARSPQLVAAGRLKPDDITEETIGRALYTAGCPTPT